MAWRQGRKRGGNAEGFDLRLWPQDRIGGPPKGRATGTRAAIPQARRP